MLKLFGGFMKIGLIIILLTFLISCAEDAKLGSSCELLKETAQDVTKVEQKNLDCVSLDGDGLCMSYSGNSPYCTQKCGPKTVCDDIDYKKQWLVGGVCVLEQDVQNKCSAQNPTGTCQDNMICENGTCIGQGCPSNWLCESPIQLLGHPFKGVYVCVKQSDYLDGLCLETSCTPNGTCDVSSGKAVCICDTGFHQDGDNLTCVAN